MVVSELFVVLTSGLACFGLWCLVEEIINQVSTRCQSLLSVRLVLLFENNAETVEWFIRRLHRVWRYPSILKISEVILADNNSCDDTYAILATFSRNHHMFHAVKMDTSIITNAECSTLVVDCRNADWVGCFRRIKTLTGVQARKRVYDRKRNVVLTTKTP